MRFSATSITANTLAPLNAITAVVLGGTSLFGGVGSMFGSLIGTCIPAVLANEFVIMGMPSFLQQVAVGAVLIVAVYIDRVRRERLP